ncbi:hypothetical protein M9434_001438 [Picochlorum sp. BPE23]|nr:hypothetical protein M9434_001438 [Picochlorum sp. BPE23]
MGMHSVAPFLLLPLLLSVCGLVRSDAAGSSCADKGFDELRLVCSDCRELETFVSDNAQLIQECFECCSPDDKDNRGFYTSAVLEYCPIVAHNHPDILNFIKEKASDFKGLRVVKKPSSVPALLLRDDASQGTPEKMHIMNWKKEQIEEFLKEKLRPDDSKIEQ